VNRHVVEESTLRERASATPSGRSPAKRVAGAASESPRRATLRTAEQGEDATLRGTQVWFARSIMAAESVPEGADEHDAAQRLTAGPRLTPLERLEIYRRGYHARLLECLADDYPVLQHALGEQVFEDLCRGFIARYPSEGPNLNFFGRRMAAFCREDGPLEPAMRRFAADLAALEWAIVEVIHAASGEPMTLEGLRDVPADAWARAKLVPNPSLRLLRFDHAVNAYFQAFKDQRDAAIPSAEPSATAIYRSGYSVWRMDLTVPMFDVLSALTAGEPLAAALGRAERSLAELDAADAALRVTHWFREWVSSGLFVGVSSPLEERE
jgi:hypothetical protein